MNATRIALLAAAASVSTLGLADTASAWKLGTVTVPAGEKVVVQSKPAFAGKNLRLLSNGAKVKIKCQTYGQTVTGTFGTSNVWNRIVGGGYVTDTKVYTGSDGLVARLCPGTRNPSRGRDAAATTMRNDYNPPKANAWGFFNGQCTSFVASRLVKGGIRDFTNWYRGQHFGNANLWDDAARAAGIPVDGTPRVGSVMQSNAGEFGHVAVVSKVLAGNRIVIEEYNYVVREGYSKRTISANGLNFIHFKR
jgi:surface antigen